MADKSKPDILDLLKKRGIPFKIVKIPLNPQIVRAVKEYILGVEEAHKRAANSKLRFKAAVKETTAALFISGLDNFLFFSIMFY